MAELRRIQSCSMRNHGVFKPGLPRVRHIPYVTRLARTSLTFPLCYQTMAEDHARKSVGECHPYREFEGMQSSISMKTSLASATGVSPWVSTTKSGHEP